jgi:excisionase family DNA binding protein
VQKRSDGEHEIMTLREVATLLRSSPHTIYDWTNRGKIPFFRLGGRKMFLRSEIERWVETLETKP